MSDNTLPPLGQDGWGSPAYIIGGLLARHALSVTGDLRAALAGEYDLLVWQGQVWDAVRCRPKAGRFWIPALFSAGRLPDALDGICKAKHCTFEDAVARMGRWHSGLGKALVSLCPWAYCEINHLPCVEQEARYDALTAATGLRWCLWVFSGGKSVHAYIAFTRPLAPDDPLRLDIQRLLVVALEADTRIVDPSRLMRLPAGSDAERQQPVLRYDREAAYDPEDVRDRLRAYLVSLGITDPDVAYTTLQLAERLANASEKSSGEGAWEMAQHVALLRATRGAPSANDLLVARAMLGDDDSRRSPAPKGSFSHGESSPRDWEGLMPGRHDYCPWCDAKSQRVLAVREVGQGLVAFCFKEHKARFSSWASESLPEPEVDLDRFVDGLVASLPQAELPDDDESDISEADRYIEVLELALYRAAVPEVPDDLLADILGPERSPVVRASLVRSRNRQERTLSGDEEEDAEAMDRFEELGGQAVWCPRGPHHHIAIGTREAKAAKLACNAYHCSVCGPRQVHALRASAKTVLRRSASQWEGVIVHLSEPSGAAMRALRRWATVAPDDRAAAGFAINPEVVGLVVMWSGADHRPLGALARHLESARAEAVMDGVHEAIDRIGEAIDLIDWSLSERRAVVLRGVGPFRHRIAELRDRVLGRSRARRPDGVPRDPEQVSVRTYTTAAELREEVSNRVLADTVDLGSEDDVRGRTQTTRWAVADPNVPLREVLRELVEERFFKPVRGTT